MAVHDHSWSESARATLAAPPPWTLEGRGIATIGRARGRLGVLVFARYTASPVGPYDEVLWIPRLKTPLTIAAIRVSTPESVVWGRRNWGIPKELASFTWEEDDGRMEVRATAPGAVVPFAYLAIEALGPRLPLPVDRLPESVRCFEQDADGRRYTFAPEGTARGGLARVRAARVPGDAEFPAVRVGALALEAERFRGILPIPAVRLVP